MVGDGNANLHFLAHGDFFCEGGVPEEGAVFLGDLDDLDAGLDEQGHRKLEIRHL